MKLLKPSRLIIAGHILVATTLLLAYMGAHEGKDTPEFWLGITGLGPAGAVLIVLGLVILICEKKEED